MRWFLILAVAALAACDVVPVQPPLPQGVPQEQGEQPDERTLRLRAETAARTFVEVVETVEPVAESECRRVAPGANCDFLIVVDDRPGQEPNAFQTLARDGRPIVAFNLALIASVRNADELAFVMGHETSHHILGHLGRMQQNAAVGAVIFSGLAAMSGANAQRVRDAEEFGAAVGARTYSKDFELEADRLGTLISLRSGYDPIRGAAFFTRIPDPGNRFLGSHPPNADRIDAVRRAVSAI